MSDSTDNIQHDDDDDDDDDGNFFVSCSSAIKLQISFLHDG
jgi:hypothetical protein